MYKMVNDGVVAMRLFANWEMDRASSSAVQRVCNLSLNRLVLNGFTAQNQSIVITAKLQGNKRSLRSNEIYVTSNHGRVDLDLDISFTIQYPHFLKRKGNILQMMIQRRRKYKNRPFPSSFKTLAVGMVNLTQLLQQGGLREIALWTSEDLEKKSTIVQSIGRIYLTSCQSQPLEFELERERGGKKHGIDVELSEDESDSDYDDMPIDSDLNEPGSGRSAVGSRDTRINSKSAHAHRKNNLRQRFVTLLRKFKVPDDEVLASSRSASVALVPTDKELQDLFEELEDMSDSGPEMAADEISIGSNPRPVLRPYFTRSREVLPAIYDRDADIVSDSDGDGDDLEWSSETENAKENCQGFGSSQTTIKDLTIMQQIPHIVGPSTPVKPQTRVGSTCSAPLASSASLLGMPHSLTTGSIARKEEKIDCSKNISIIDQLSLLLSDSGVSRDCIWLCSLSDFPHLSSLSITMINSSSSTFIKQAMAQIVNKIQNFCNSNSANPPITYIGIMGGDKIVGQVVRAYVDCLHHKSSSNWLQYLRFVLLPCPHSLMARLIEGIDPAIDQLSRDIWERWADLSTFEKASINDRLEKWSSGTGGCFSLPIGEALLQLADRGGELEAGRVFVPFLSEVRVGQTEDDSESAGTSPRGGTDDKEPSGATSMPSGSSCSPPNSPHIRTDVHEMHVEYWLGKDCGNENVCLAYSQNTTPTSKKDSSKGSMKAAFRTLIVSRVSSHPLLSLTFVKEKRKEKMLQKLGMKKGQKSDMESPPVQISHVARLLCSGTSKHSDLIVNVDGVAYQGVRYFQTSSQWQTHVKSFPISLLSPNVPMNTS